MEKIIEIKDLYVDYYNVEALKKINLTIYRNDFVGIIGPNGGGKTTLIKSILKLLKPKAGSLKVLEDSISYVPQFSNLDRQYPISCFDMVLTSFLKKGLHPFFRYRKKHYEEVEKALEMVKISDLKNRHISELSGGEFQRLLLARAIVSKPKLLLLDEPTANVDATSKELVYEVLNRLNQDMTIIMVAHDFDLKSINLNRIVYIDTSIMGDKKI